MLWKKFPSIELALCLIVAVIAVGPSAFASRISQQSIVIWNMWPLRGPSVIPPGGSAEYRLDFLAFVNDEIKGDEPLYVDFAIYDNDVIRDDTLALPSVKAAPIAPRLPIVKATLRFELRCIKGKVSSMSFVNGISPTTSGERTAEIFVAHAQTARGAKWVGYESNERKVTCAKR